MHRTSHKCLITTVPNPQRGPLIDPTTDVIIQDTMARIHEKLMSLCLLNAIAWEMFKNLQPTNNFDPDHQGPPPYLDSLGISHQVSSPPPNSRSSGICQQESAPLFSDVTETYPQVLASYDQNSSEISHQVLAPDSDQK